MDLEYGYGGDAEKFLHELLPNILPSPSSVANWQNDIISIFERRPITMIVRRFANKPRAFVEAWPGDPEVDYVISDNTPAIWCYVRCALGESPNILEMINKRQIPIALALRKDERANQNWPTIGAPELNAVYSRRLKHCHILPCNTRGVAVNDVQELQRRSLRLLSPLNHFLFPSPRRFGMSIQQGSEMSHNGVDLGEDPRIIAMVRWYFYSVHMRDYRNLVETSLLMMGDDQGIDVRPNSRLRIDIIPGAKMSEISKDKQWAKVSERYTETRQEHIKAMTHDDLTMTDSPITRIDDLGQAVDSSVHLNEATYSHNSQRISGSKGKRKFLWRLAWMKHAGAAVIPIGLYSLDLDAMVQQGFIGREGDGYRLKVFHEVGGFYIRTGRSGSRIKIAEAIRDEE